MVKVTLILIISLISQFYKVSSRQNTLNNKQNDDHVVIVVVVVVVIVVVRFRDRLYIGL